MKYIALLLLFPSLAFAQSPRAQNAVVWTTEFSKIVAQRDWDHARLIAPMGEKEFSQTPAWNAAAFQATWRFWQQGNAYNSWSVGQDQRSMWRLADNAEALSSSVGIRREATGSWWLLFARPLSAPVWPCPESCWITVRRGDQTLRWSVRPPPQQASGTRVLGMALPTSLLNNTVQHWTITFPDGKEEDFDMSFVPMVCNYRLKSCFVSNQQ